MRRLPDIESTLHGDFSDVADQKLLQWMVARRCRAAQVVAGVAPVKVAAGAVQEISPAEVEDIKCKSN